MNTIKQETITKVMKAMNEFNDHLGGGNRITTADSKNIVSKYGLSNGVFYDAVSLGYFTRLSLGEYKPNMIRFSPYEARKIHVETLYKKHHKKNGSKHLSSHRPKKRAKIIRNMELDGKNNEAKRLEINKRQREYYHKNKKNTSLKLKSIPTPKIHKKAYEALKTPIKARPKKHKEFSLFWGLIKFNY